MDESSEARQVDFRLGAVTMIRKDARRIERESTGGTFWNLCGMRAEAGGREMRKHGIARKEIAAKK